MQSPFRGHKRWRRDGHVYSNADEGSRNVCKETLKSEVANFFLGLVHPSSVFIQTEFLYYYVDLYSICTCYKLTTNTISTYLSDPTEDRAAPFCGGMWAVLGGDLKSARLLWACPRSVHRSHRTHQPHWSPQPRDAQPFTATPSPRYPGQVHLGQIKAGDGGLGLAKPPAFSALVLWTTSHVILGSGCAGLLVCRQACKWHTLRPTQVHNNEDGWQDKCVIMN